MRFCSSRARSFDLAAALERHGREVFGVKAWAVRFRPQQPGSTLVDIDAIISALQG